MKKKALLLTEMIERERAYFDTCQEGSEEYAASQARLMKLEEQLDSYKDQKSRTGIEWVKAAGGIALPVFGWVVITAFEKGDTITSALKQTIGCFIPKKL